MKYDLWEDVYSRKYKFPWYCRSKLLGIVPLGLISFVFPLFYTFLKKTELLNLFIVYNYTDWCIDDPNVIDFYIMWVNGSDPVWFKRMKETAYKTHSRLKKKYFRMRFEDHAELKWSLRSIEKFTPWVNKIHVVTDNQFPNWMNLSHPKLHFVSHEYMFYPGYHSYNSNAVQFLMYRIPGISRRVVMMDDDCIFLNHITPSYFFDELNRTVIHTHKHHYNPKARLPHCRYSDSGSVYKYGIEISHQLIYQKFHETLPIKNAHLQNPVDMKTLLEMHKVFDIDSRSFLPFRRCGDYQFQTFVNLYSAITNRSVLADIEDSLSIHTPKKLKEFYPNNASIILVCVNFYDEYFYESYLPTVLPEKSSFEL